MSLNLYLFSKFSVLNHNSINNICLSNLFLEPAHCIQRLLHLIEAKQRFEVILFPTLTLLLLTTHPFLGLLLMRLEFLMFFVGACLRVTLVFIYVLHQVLASGIYLWVVEPELSGNDDWGQAVFVDGDLPDAVSLLLRWVSLSHLGVEKKFVHKGKDKRDAHYKEKTTDFGKGCDRSVTPENLLVDHRKDWNLHVDPVERGCRNVLTVSPIVVEFYGIWHVDLAILIILTWIIISFYEPLKEPWDNVDAEIEIVWACHVYKVYQLQSVSNWWYIVPWLKPSRYLRSSCNILSINYFIDWLRHFKYCHPIFNHVLKLRKLITRFL